MTFSRSAIINAITENANQQLFDVEQKNKTMVTLRFSNANIVPELNT